MDRLVCVFDRSEGDSVALVVAHDENGGKEAENKTLDQTSAVRSAVVDDKSETPQLQ